MENKKSILAGSVIASAILGLTSINANATSLTSYSALGSGAEVRSELLSTPSAINAFELTCGEKGKTSDTKTKDAKCGDKAKAKDGKCGEGKCGDKKKDGKGKAKDGKCGEGKCGDKKKATKDPK